jgi:hypothetical protein
MTTIRYKGFRILSRPYQLQPSARWAVELEIGRNGRRERFSTEERYPTEEQADARCTGLGRRIIDGRVPGWTVGHLRNTRGVASGRSTLLGAVMRQLVIVGIVLLGLGTAAFLRNGATAYSSRGSLVADTDPVPDEQPWISPWLIGGAVLSGLLLLVISARPRT